jgi:5-carboxymethyl-2-hydroxymuconate isomerase
MPHTIVEYSDNLAAEGDIPGLLKTIAAKLCDSGGVLPIGGVRVRAHRVSEYVIADGKDDYAFLHAVVKLGTGRTVAFKERFFDELFQLIKAHFAELASRRYLALSMYVEEVDENGAYRHNNIHRKFKA